MGAAAAFGQSTVASTNWSGYAVTGSNFTDVVGSWTIPTLTASASGTTYLASWVGLDGYSNGTVEQCGIEQQITSGGATSINAWYEFAPAAEVPVSLTVHPGDTIDAEVTYEPSLSSTGHYGYQFIINDVTDGQSYNQVNYTSSNDSRASAEWIAEAPTVNNSQSTVANFSSVTFTGDVAAENSGADQSLSSFGSSISGIQLLASKSGPTVAVPSWIDSDGQTFTDYYDSSVPSLTWTDNSGNKQWNLTSANWSGLSRPAAYGDGAGATFNDSNGGSGNYNVTLNTTVSPGFVSISNSSGAYTISGSGRIAGGGSLTKSGSNTATLDTVNTYTGGTNVQAGTLVIGASGGLASGAVNITGGALQLGASTGAETITSLAISSTGTLDVNNNHIFIDYGSGADPIGSIAALLKTGYANGNWNGAGGIVSSAAASNKASYGLGYADSADAGNPAALAAGTIEVKYTLLGDADLNGVVNGIDFGILAANFNKGVTAWDQGDFDYNGIVNGIDFGLLAANFNKGASGAAVSGSNSDVAALDAFAAANGLLADVPEPTCPALLAVSAAGLLRRRLRRI